MENQQISEEWQNIPVIIPNTILDLQKQVEQLQAQLKSYIESRTLIDKIELLQSQIQQQSNHIQQNTQQFPEIQTQISTIQKELKKVTEKEFNEAIVQTEMSTIKAEEVEDISEDEHSEDEHSEYQESIEHPKKKSTNMQKPRMFTVDMVKKLIFKYLNRSKLKQKVVEQQVSVIPTVLNGIEDLNQKYERVMEDVKIEIVRIYERIDFDKSGVESLFEEINQKFKDISSWSKVIDKEFQEFTRIQQDVKEKNEELLESYDTVKQFTKKVEDRLKESTREINEKLTEQLNERFGEVSQQFSSVDAQIQQVKLESNTHLEESKQFIISKFERELDANMSATNNIINEAKSEIEQQILDYRRIHESDAEKFEKSFNQQKVDLQQRMKKVEIAITDQQNALNKFVQTEIEPSHIAEARLYAIEARMKEEESQRLDQVHFVKDIFRKLVFSLEQAQINALSAKEASRDIEESSFLYLKRLGFLKKLVQFSAEESNIPPVTRGRSSGTRFTRSLAENSVEESRLNFSADQKHRPLYSAFHQFISKQC